MKSLIIFAAIVAVGSAGFLDHKGNDCVSDELYQMAVNTGGTHFTWGRLPKPLRTEFGCGLRCLLEMHEFVDENGRIIEAGNLRPEMFFEDTETHHIPMDALEKIHNDCKHILNRDNAFSGCFIAGKYHDCLVNKLAVVSFLET